jgi:regulatory protein
MSTDNHYSIDAENAFIKASAYCVYRDRCRKEITLKLKEWKLDSSDIPDVIEKLVNEGFIDEERFAIAFARGKFRINKWGKIKITGFLRMNGLPDVLIRKAVSEIDSGEYRKTLVRIIETKARSLKEKDIRSRNAKLINFAVTKGFETELIKEILHTEIQ